MSTSLLNLIDNFPNRLHQKDAMNVETDVKLVQMITLKSLKITNVIKTAKIRAQKFWKVVIVTIVVTSNCKYFFWIRQIWT